MASYLNPIGRLEWDEFEDFKKGCDRPVPCTSSTVCCVQPWRALMNDLVSTSGSRRLHANAIREIRATRLLFPPDGFLLRIALLNPLAVLIWMLSNEVIRLLYRRRVVQDPARLFPNQSRDSNQQPLQMISFEFGLTI